MNASGWIKERLLVPRWRSFSSTVASGELASTKRQSVSSESTGDQTDARLREWRSEPTLITAAQVVEAALVELREKDATSAAHAILKRFPTARPMIRRQANALLMRAGEGEEQSDSKSILLPHNATDWRAALRVYPRDAIGWTELAFYQVVNGASKSAIRSASIALALAPNNRHVLRSAARLFLHADDRERAHDVILRSSATRADPWLIAAEISLARAAERSPRTIKIGEGFIKARDMAPRNLSELAGAIGTEYLLDGRRGLRKLFVQSLEDPTANSLAQGEWASRAIGDNLVPNEQFGRVPEAFEALAFHQYRELDFAAVPDTCVEWARTDLFSVRPYEFGAAAAAHAQDFERSAKMAQEGLKRRPTGALLLNSLAFAEASLGNVDHALRTLQLLARLRVEEPLRYVASANLGLCSFRLGLHEKGVGEYRKAIEGLTRLGAHVDSASARVYLAREALFAELPDASKFLLEAEKALKPFPTAEAQLVLRRLKGEDVDTSLAQARETRRTARHLARLRSVTWTTPGAPGADGVVNRLKF